MNKFCYFTVVFAIVLFDTSVRGLQCFQGQRRFRNGNQIADTLSSLQCSNPSHICHSYDISITQSGNNLVVEQGICSPENECTSNDCERFAKNLERSFPGSNLISCAYACCRDDNCNHAAGLGFKSWVIVTFSLLAFGFSKFLSV